MKKLNNGKVKITAVAEIDAETYKRLKEIRSTDLYYSKYPISEFFASMLADAIYAKIENYDEEE